MALSWHADWHIIHWNLFRWYCRGDWALNTMKQYFKKCVWGATTSELLEWLLKCQFLGSKLNLLNQIFQGQNPATCINRLQSKSHARELLTCWRLIYNSHSVHSLRKSKKKEKIKVKENTKAIFKSIRWAVSSVARA